jgi:hypothetical protein
MRRCVFEHITAIPAKNADSERTSIAFLLFLLLKSSVSRLDPTPSTCVECIGGTAISPSEIRIQLATEDALDASDAIRAQKRRADLSVSPSAINQNGRSMGLVSYMC